MTLLEAVDSDCQGIKPVEHGLNISDYYQRDGSKKVIRSIYNLGI